MDWIKARLIDRKFWTDTLYSIEVEGELGEYQAGQYAQLGMMIDDTLVKRAYSFVNPPHPTNHEFYLVEVPDGQLSPHLAKAPIGTTLWLAEHASGFFTLNEVPDSEHLLLLSTGTAVGPFLSMLYTQQPWQRFKRVTLVHGVRYNQDINYRAHLADIAQRHPQFQYIPVVSREEPQIGLAGRITSCLADGQLARYGQFTLSPATTQVMICGNPAMLRETRDWFKAQGFLRNLRRKPGQITQESYW